MTDFTRAYGTVAVPRRVLLRMTVVTEGGMLLVAVLLCLAWGNEFWHTAALTPRALTLGAGLGLAFLAAAIAFLESPLRLAEQIRRDLDHLVALFGHAKVIDLLAISLLAGIGEEALFRGFLQPFAADFIGLPAAIVLVSVAFGAVHCISRAYITFAAVLGLVFGLLHAWSGNIVVPMTAHAAYDFIALLYGVKWRGFPRETSP